jgi:MFS family permease
MAQTNSLDERGAVAGWLQAGQLGGQGIGGGAGLWLAQHGGGDVGAAILMATITLLCAVPLRRVRLPHRVPGTPLAVQFRSLGRALRDTLRTRRGTLAMLLALVPAGLAASANLWGAVAGDWNASADLVALTTGALGGVVSIPGALIGGYLCDRFSRPAVFVGCGFGSAAGLIVMALAPHTPAWFGAMVLINAMLTGMAWASQAAVIFDCLGLAGAATLGAVYSSASNLPVPVVTMIVGKVQTAHGSTAMLLTEAGLAVVSLSAMIVLMSLWRAAPTANPQPAS